LAVKKDFNFKGGDWSHESDLCQWIVRQEGCSMKQARPLRRVVSKEEYVLLTGDHVSAVLLSQIEYWTRRTYDFDRFLAEEHGRVIVLVLCRHISNDIGGENQPDK
jgi:kynureninase